MQSPDGGLFSKGNNAGEERVCTILRLQQGIPPKAHVKKWALV